MWIWYTLWSFVTVLGIGTILFSAYLDRNEKGVKDPDWYNIFGFNMGGAVHKPHDGLMGLGAIIVIIGIFALFILDAAPTVQQLLENPPNR